MNIRKGSYGSVVSNLWLVMPFMLIFMTACGGGGGGNGSGTGNGSGNAGRAGPIDTTAPTVTSMSPGQESQGIGINTKLTATFSEAMTAGQINGNNFRLTDGGASYIPGSVSYDSTNHIAVFTPSSSLIPSVRYTATIITGTEDLDGSPITKDFAWDFVAGTSTDSTAPAVIATIPANSATNVPLNGKISSTFSKDVDSTTLTPASFVVTGPGGAPVSGAVNYIDRTAVFTPAQALVSNTTYTATVNTNVVDLEGNTLPGNVAWNFTTGANRDVSAPVINSTSPASGDTNVAVNSTINIAFSEPMDPTTITTANFIVTGPGTTPVIGTMAFDASNNTAIFTRNNHLTTPVGNPPPVSNLDANTTYTVTVTAGVEDMESNSLGSSLVWSFTTAP